MRAHPWITGLAIGAGVMYLLDPRSGSRRRALTRDKARHLAHQTTEATGKAGRDFANRARGLAHAATRVVRRDRPDDAVLRERVRATLGRHVSRPSAIEVECAGGDCTLRGQVLAAEADGLLAAVGRVPGVSTVLDELERREADDDDAALQGTGTGADRDPDAPPGDWAPATRLLAAVPAAALLGRAAVRRDPLSMAAGAIGGALLLRSLTNRSFGELLGRARPERGLDAGRSLEVGAPVETVFDLFAHPERFPLFMEHLETVEPLGEGRYRWQARGPAGLPVSWETVVAELEPNRRIAWRTVGDSGDEGEGQVRFEPTAAGGTRIHIQATSQPATRLLRDPLGAVLAGAGPRHLLDEDLVRLKSLLEDGKTRARGVPVRLEDVGTLH
jgi:uncharacterized membrane protein